MARVLAFSCTHAPAMHPKYVSFLKRIHKKYKCNRVVHLGDSVDWHAISYHEKDPALPSPEQEYKEAYKQIQSLYKAFPKLDYIKGNHSDLPSRKAKSIGLPNDVLMPFKKLWDVPGWTIHPRYHDLIIDDVIYRHGDKGKGGQMAAHKNAQSEFRSVVQGHLHAQCGVVYHANQEDCVFGLQVGCGCDHDHPAMSYGRIYALKPILAAGIILDGKTAIIERMFL